MSATARAQDVEERERVEHVHEAARAVIALLCRLDFEIVTHDAVVGLRPATKQDFAKHLLVLFAGPAAESHFTGTVMSDNDYNEAWRMLRAFNPSITPRGIEGVVQICKKEALQLVRSNAVPIEAVAAELELEGMLSRDEVEAIVRSRIAERVCG